jgi:enediyne biosynthesis protein E4
MFVSNIAAPWAVQESHFLWQSTGEIARMNDGYAPYVDVGEEAGVAHSSWGWDSRFADFDNDGVQEAIQATGFLKGRIARWPNLAELALVNDRIAHDPAYWPNISPEADVNGRSSSC